MNNVNPPHYTSGKVAPIDLIKAYNLNFNRGNAIKYIARADQKNKREDIVKAVWYLLDDLGMDREAIKRLTDTLADEEGTEHIRVSEEVTSGICC